MLKSLRYALTYLAVGLVANGASAQDLTDLTVGEMRTLAVHETPAPVSDRPFLTESGEEGTLSDYAGRYVLLNFWATWCAPCRHEMPALDALQAAFGGETFEVVTLATGRNPLPAIERFFEENGLTGLPKHRDIQQGIARDMGVFGLPITVLIDPEGREIARMRGEADWNSTDAHTLIAALLSAPTE